MEEMQKFMTVTGEGGPCIIYPQETEKPKRIDNVGTVLETLYDGLDSIFAPFIGRLHDGVVSNSDFSAEIDSLLNSAQGSQQSVQNPTINTYPFGEPSGIFRNYLAVCRQRRTPKYPLSEALEKIDNWCKEWYDPSKGKTSRGISKHVLIIADQWDPADFQPYEDTFRKLAMHEDFWFIFILATNNALYDISFLPHEFYKFTRHIADAQPIGNINIKDISTVILPFEGLADVNILPDGKKSSHFIVEDGEEKYCVTAGSYRGSGNTIETAIAIGKWDGKAYSALAQVPYPISMKEYNKQSQGNLTKSQNADTDYMSAMARSSVMQVYKDKNKTMLFEAYRNIAK